MPLIYSLQKLQNILLEYHNYRRYNIMATKSKEEILKAIKTLEHRERYSKNPLEKRQLRSQIGKLQRELKMYN